MLIFLQNERNKFPINLDKTSSTDFKNIEEFNACIEILNI
uniref:Uncharacterized protein n=1 Tax=Lepeophtheirus salmonis TaxID=72036 RepID=A0A0K2VCK6_LEPSM